jgi:quinol monooxygenase YgiN
MVIQIVRVEIKPEQRERWLELVRANAAQTRTEAGCESYSVTADVERPNRFVLVEYWASMEAQFEHFRQPAFRELLANVGEVVAAPPDVVIHEVASTQTLEEALATAGIGSANAV